MKKVSQVSIDVLGHNPCDFALVGLGLLARKEVTPFSDFENIIVLNDAKKYRKIAKTHGACYCEELEYFRWYAVIFQVVIINLKETSLHSVAIPSLNDSNTSLGNWFFDAFTKRGISFDSMMPYASKNPLGRQPTKNKPFTTELIKPVSEMVNYLTQEQDVKNGYHLSDILTYTCLVAGSDNVYSDFEMKRENVLKRSKSYNKEEIKNIIKEDMQIHSTKLGISSTIDKDTYNVKQLAYRSTTIFITGIAKWHGMKPGSCFDIVRDLEEKSHITLAFSHKLQYAVALACEIRLKTYLNHGCQCDCIEGADESILTNMMGAVGERCWYNYLEIACCLQYDAIAYFKLDVRYTFFNPVTMCIAISSLLHTHMYDRLSALKNYIMHHRNLPEQPLRPKDNDDDEQLDGEDKDIWKPNKFCTTIDQSKIRVKSERWLGSWFEKMQALNQKVDHFHHKSYPYTHDATESLFEILYSIGNHLFNARAYFEAEYCYKTALKQLPRDADDTDCQRIEIAYCIGMCLSRSRLYDNALTKFCEALDFLKASSSESKKELKGECVLQKAMCQRHLGKTKEALKSFDAALNMFYNNESKTSFCMQNKGICFINMKMFEDALSQFEQLHKFHVGYKNVSQTSKATCLFYLGTCLQNLGRYDEASKILKECIKILQHQLDHESKEPIKAIAYIRIGNCFKAINNFKEAIRNFRDSLQLWNNLDQDYPDDPLVYYKLNKAIAQKRIGNYLFQYSFCEEAIEHYQKSLDIFTTLSNQRSYLVWNIYDLHKHLGGAFRGLGDFETALEHYQQCKLLVNEKTKSMVEADLNRQIGDCKKKLGKNGNEIELALKAYFTLLENEPRDERVWLKSIGMCYWNAGDIELAKEYFEKYLDNSENPKSLLSSVDIYHFATVLKFMGKIRLKENYTAQEKLRKNHYTPTVKPAKISNKDKESNVKDAKSFFEKSLQKFLELPKESGYEHEVAYLYNKIGNCWLDLARLTSVKHAPKPWKDIAKNSFQKAESYLNDTPELNFKGKEQLAFVYKNLGNLSELTLSNPKASHAVSSQLSEAISYYEKAAKCFRNLHPIKYQNEVAWLLKSIGTCYQMQKNWVEASERFKEALSTYNMSTAKTTTRVLVEVAYLKKNLGKCYNRQDMHKAAIGCCEEAIEAYSNLQDSNHERDIAWIHMTMAYSYKDLAENQDAISCFRKALSIYQNMVPEKQSKENVQNIEQQLEILKKLLCSRQRHFT